MPKADQNLDMIYRQERPTGDAVRSMMLEVTECLQNIHSKNLVHGDLKMLNVVQFNHRLRIIDMDSSVILNPKEDAEDPSPPPPVYYGRANSFSSSLVPPEMLYTFKNEEEVENYESYWRGPASTRKSAALNPQGDAVNSMWESTLKPVTGHDSKRYCFKVWRADDSADDLSDNQSLVSSANAYHIDPTDFSLLPYEVLTADASFDVWAFGCMFYTICAGAPLFVADCDDCLVAEEMENLASWTDARKEHVVMSRVSDPMQQSLLLKLLSQFPEDRFESMSEVIAHPYFADPGSSDPYVLSDRVAAVERIAAEMNSLSLKMAENKRRVRELIEGKNRPLARVCEDHLRVLDTSVSSTIRRMFEYDFQVPRAFVIVPESKNGALVWVDALGNILKLLDAEGSKGSGSKIDSVRDEFLKALNYYGESRYELHWIDEMNGKIAPGGGVVTMSFLNALRFMPLMVTGLKVLSSNFGAKALADCLNVPLDKVPKALILEAGKVDAVDLAYDFDEFQGQIDDYGAYLDELEQEKQKKAAEARKEAGKKLEQLEGGKKEEEQKEGEQKTDPNASELANLSVTLNTERDLETLSPAIAVTEEMKEAPQTPPAASPLPRKQSHYPQSPFELHKYSHATQMQHFDDFIMSRDREYTLSGLCRVQLPLSPDTCIWTSPANADVIDAAATSVEVVSRNVRLDELNKQLGDQAISITAHKNSIKKMKTDIEEKEAMIAVKDEEIVNHLATKEALQQSMEGLEQNNFEKTMKIKEMAQQHADALKAQTSERDILKADLTQQIMILQEEMKTTMEDKEAAFFAERDALEDSMDATNKMQAEQLDKKEEILQKQQDEYSALQTKLKESHDKFEQDMKVAREKHDEELKERERKMKEREETTERELEQMEREKREHIKQKEEQHLKALTLKEDDHEREISNRGRLETEQDELEERLNKCDSQLMELQDQHELLENESRYAHTHTAPLAQNL